MDNNMIAANITELRKKAGITQEQLATAVNVTAQAVSKWETNTCQPDIATLPLISAYFHVSIDYLFFGKDITYDDIYGKSFQKVASYPQMSKESFEEALKIFASAHHGISHGNLQGKELMYDTPSHISDANGISLLCGKGYGAILTRDFFAGMNKNTIAFTQDLLQALAEKNCVSIISAVISMSDISYIELKEKTAIDDKDLRPALDILIKHDLLIENKSKHKILGTTYKVNDMYHTCLCILLATMQMQKITLNDISCCMGYGDYPIDFNA